MNKYKVFFRLAVLYPFIKSAYNLFLIYANKLKTIKCIIDAISVLSISYLSENQGQNSNKCFYH